jgi:mono/diheme cytochrome c family protein
MKTTTTMLVAALAAATAFVACSRGTEQQPASEGTTAPSDPGSGGGALAALKVPEVAFSTAQPDIDKGKELFAQKGCSACHKIGGGKLVGPDLKGVTARRDKQWIAKMILRPDLMVKEDPTAKDLFKTFMTAMPNQNVPEGDLPALMSFLKANE